MLALTFESFFSCVFFSFLFTYEVALLLANLNPDFPNKTSNYHPLLDQMVERPLSMREVPESIPGFSFFFQLIKKYETLICFVELFLILENLKFGILIL